MESLPVETLGRIASYMETTSVLSWASTNRFFLNALVESTRITIYLSSLKPCQRFKAALLRSNRLRLIVSKITIHVPSPVNRKDADDDPSTEYLAAVSRPSMEATRLVKDIIGSLPRLHMVSLHGADFEPSEHTLFGDSHRTLKVLYLSNIPATTSGSGWGLDAERLGRILSLETVENIQVCSTVRLANTAWPISVAENRLRALALEDTTIGDACLQTLIRSCSGSLRWLRIQTASNSQLSGRGLRRALLPVSERLEHLSMEHYPVLGGPFGTDQPFDFNSLSWPAVTAAALVITDGPAFTFPNLESLYIFAIDVESVSALDSLVGNASRLKSIGIDRRVLASHRERGNIIVDTLASRGVETFVGPYRSFKEPSISEYADL